MIELLSSGHRPRRASVSWGGNILLLEHVQVHSTTGPESRTQAVNHFRLNLHPLPATASCAALAPFFSELKRNEAGVTVPIQGCKERRGVRTCPSAWLSSGHSCHRNPARRRRPERHRPFSNGRRRSLISSHQLARAN